MIVDNEVERQASIPRQLGGSKPIASFSNCQDRLRTKATQGAPKLPCVGKRRKGEPTGNRAREPAASALRPESKLPVSNSRQAPRRLRYRRPPLDDHQSLGGVVLEKPV